jgi:hypothetical protein
MLEAVSRIKDPAKVRAGQLGGRAKYADPARRTCVRIGDLTSDQRRIVLALVDAARHTKTGPTNETSGPVTSGGTSDATTQV